MKLLRAFIWKLLGGSQMNTTTRRKYPKNWKQISRECRELAGWQCQKCFISHGTLKMTWAGDKMHPVWLVAAHPNHDPWNPDAELICLCPSCHWRYYRRKGQSSMWIVNERRKHRTLIQAAGYPVPACEV
jgi:hypothetical protein